MTWRPTKSDAIAGLGAGVLGAGDRMPRNELRQPTPERSRAAATTSCLVLPASVTTVRSSSASASDVEHAAILRDRCGDQHDVGVGDLVRPVRRRACSAAIDRRRARAPVEIGARAADADDLSRRAPAARKRQRARAADQSDADDDEFVDAHARCQRVGVAERRRERGEEARVLRGQPDGDAQPLGKP